jgi:protein-S-isoprenylcysteine O-methyltransferase Ste14
MFNTMQKIKKAYHSSAGAAAVMVVLLLVVFFQTLRMYAGHTDSNWVKLLKIGTALAFVLWCGIYLAKQKNA